MYMRIKNKMVTQQHRQFFQLGIAWLFNSCSTMSSRIHVLLLLFCIFSSCTIAPSVLADGNPLLLDTASVRFWYQHPSPRARSPHPIFQPAPPLYIYSISSACNNYNCLPTMLNTLQLRQIDLFGKKTYIPEIAVLPQQYANFSAHNTF